MKKKVNFFRENLNFISRSVDYREHSFSLFNSKRFAMNSKFVYSEKELTPELTDLLNTLREEYPLAPGENGINLSFCRISADETVSEVERSGDGFLVKYNTTAAAARGVGSVLSGIVTKETTSFENMGIMLDVSRGMVMKLEQLKRWFRRLALSGCNLVLLYTEDTYKLPGEPFFGRYRGGYSMEELQDLDSYAKKLGIELIGCIQTLGHMEQMLRWKHVYGPVSDTPQELLVDEEKTYELLEKMICFWSQALTSRRLHIGMDETQNLGRGKFLTKYGYQNPFEILTRHLNRVNAICGKYGFKPMIWGDMYFRFANEKHEYYDWTSEIPEEIRNQIPKNIELVYWDYAHDDPEVYRNMIKRHKYLGFNPIFGSGIWTWPTPWYNHSQTYKTVIPGIKACREEKVKDVFFTMWGDDGAYCNYDSALMGITFSTDIAWGVEPENEADTAKRFAAICGGIYEAAKKVPDTCSLGEFYLLLMAWDDPILGIFYDDMVARLGQEKFEWATEQCRTAIQELEPYRAEKAAGDYDHLLNTLTLIVQKIDFRRVFKAAYRANDKETLKFLAETIIPKLQESLKKFDASFRAQWMRCSKPEGLERIQLRNGGLASRLEETACRIREYLADETCRITELEEPPYGEKTAWLHSYGQIATGSVNRF